MSGAGLVASLIAGSAALSLLLLAAPAQADFSQAIVIGANRSVDRELPPLRYADDDAVRFVDLFRTVGVKTYVLTRLDESTHRLYPQAAAETRPPTAGDLRAAVKQAASDAADARARGERTNLYVVFAGHGNARRGRAYVTLEDARLYPEDILREVVDVVAPGQAHVIIDACHSHLFAMARGPGGTHRPLSGFLDRSLGPRMAKVGFLLSSSQSGESHEWEAFQSGVFSHEVRSGLVGAADVDGDGTISYREIAAFVARANAAIVNERYRPTVYARSPPGAEVLLDLRAVRASRLHVDGRTGGKHFLVEDARGVRWSDFHVRLGQAVNLLLPAANRPLYVRSVADRQESVVTETHQEVILSEQATHPSQTGSRGAAQHVFQSLFNLPFDRDAVASFELQLEESLEDEPEVKDAPGRGLRRYGGFAALAVAAGGAGGGGYLLLKNRVLYNAVGPDADQAAAVEQNRRIENNNRTARWLFGGAAAVATAGLLLLLWPASDDRLALIPHQGGASVQVTLRR